MMNVRRLFKSSVTGNHLNGSLLSSSAYHMPVVRLTYIVTLFSAIDIVYTSFERDMF